MVRKAVIPAAGFGTRLLPASKALPKEMLPIVDIPAIQLVVEEAVASGLTDILLVISKGKRAIEEHFDRSWDLERELESKGRLAELEALRRVSSMADIHYVWQQELRGLGDAIAQARRHVGDEPFAVLLGDCVYDAPEPVTRQLLEVFERHHGPVVAVEEVEPAKVGRYGIVSGKPLGDDVYELDGLVEKPAPAEAPSNLAIAGRYVFTPAVFEHIARTKPGKNNEIQITDAMRSMLADGPLFAAKAHGKRHDIGNKLDFLKTNIVFGLKRPDIRADLLQFMKNLVKEL